MKKPFFSVITICMNSSKYIGNALESLYSQDFRNFEHIIQDGQSLDETFNIIKSFKDEED